MKNQLAQINADVYRKAENPTRPVEQSEHSPLPWKGGNNANGIPCIWTTTPGVNLIAKLYHIPHEMSDEANAAYIVQACNEYPKLIQALKDIRDCAYDPDTVAEVGGISEGNVPLGKFASRIYSVANAALSNATT